MLLCGNGIGGRGNTFGCDHRLKSEANGGEQYRLGATGTVVVSQNPQRYSDFENKKGPAGP